MDRDMVRRVGALAWFLTASLAAVMLAVWPPDRHGKEVGWLVAAALIAAGLLSALLALRRSELSLRTSLVVSVLSIVGLGALQWLAGEPARYSTLIALPLVFVAASHTWRHVALAAQISPLVLVPTLATASFSTAAVAASAVNVIIWLCLAAMALLWTAGVRWQRLALRHGEQEAQHLALHDPVTGLGNRRKLTADLDAALSEGRAAALALFDLNGFKAYNDAFGHPAGDALLARLAARLASVAQGIAEAYRMGGDEFCLLARPDADVVTLGCNALSDTGPGFQVSAAGGAVLLPSEADQAADALRVADQRMYAEKHRQRDVATRDGAALVFALLQQRYPQIGEHIEEVVRRSIAVGARLGLGAEDLLALRRAAELHDIGKLAIPDAILEKAGPLSDAEWEFVRHHTLVGERIVAVSPELSPIGEIIRASHERYDGKGYPDHLPPAEIPLASRIIAVCDAYDAMTSTRTYRPGKNPAQAIAELQRCAGTQFDPHVVNAFTDILTEPSHRTPPA